MSKMKETENSISQENTDKELIGLVKKFLSDYDSREKTKTRMIRIGALSKVVLISAVIIGMLAFYIPFLAKFHNMGQPQVIPKDMVSAIKIDRPIGDGSGMISANEFSQLLNRAYRNGNARGVILYMNSPGGSPVESDVMYHRIKDFKERYPHIKIVSVVQDMCASGCYYVASATDKIYASETSMVGSIGVVMSGFGFKEALEKLGVERRVFTAGESKAFLDPFNDIEEANMNHITNILEGAHEVFINRVREGRGKILNEDSYDDIFTGLIWLTKDAIERGLIDDVGNVYDVVRKEFGSDSFIFLDVRERTSLLDILFSSEESFVKGLLSEITDDNTYSLEYR